MPTIYLSPSTQEWNPYITGGTEEYYMNLIADVMEPYLRASGINFTRNTPDMTAASSVRASNSGNYDLHLALHSNAAPEGRSGQVRGSEVYYYPTSTQGKRAAEIIAENLKAIYPNPNLVKTVPTTTIGEVAKTRAPAVLIEFAYHDNVDDANWITENIEEIARNVVLSLTEFFGIPFNNPQAAREGVVHTTNGALNIRQAPSLSAPIIGWVYNGIRVPIYGQDGDWYVISHNGKEGYANSNYITLVTP